MRGRFFLFSTTKRDSFAPLMQVRIQANRFLSRSPTVRTCLLDASECKAMAQMRRVFADAPLAMLPSWWFTAAEAGEEWPHMAVDGSLAYTVTTERQRREVTNFRLAYVPWRLLLLRVVVSASREDQPGCRKR